MNAQQLLDYIIKPTLECKRIYNAPLGTSAFEKFQVVWFKCELDKTML